ncbi:AsnC family protein [Lentzea terrae]|uniref:AsnC family protein n=1 Tax=Lentzea terrae TaxID=2200761 RepID=UPI001E5B02C8|nr:AsnC family protein [Lentzea terrae]
MELQRNATQAYAALGKAVGLSAGPPTNGSASCGNRASSGAGCTPSTASPGRRRSWCWNRSSNGPS